VHADAEMANLSHMRVHAACKLRPPQRHSATLLGLVFRALLARSVAVVVYGITQQRPRARARSRRRGGQIISDTTLLQLRRRISCGSVPEQQGSPLIFA
jgi:hypothetical protein